MLCAVGKPNYAVSVEPKPTKSSRELDRFEIIDVKGRIHSHINLSGRRYCPEHEDARTLMFAQDDIRAAGTRDNQRWLRQERGADMPHAKAILCPAQQEIS